MPPPLPDRYRLEVRVGRDDDIEEWLATDTQLDRPVLVRILGPESRPERRAGFVAATTAAAGVTHPNLSRVYEVQLIDEGAYSVSEWPGGIRLSDRSSAGLPMDTAALLANGEALAHGLAALHTTGAVHGAIDPSAVFVSTTRPAKLAAFGRPARITDPADDVRALAAVIEEAITGRPARSVPPSEVVDGLSPLIDGVFDELDRRHLTADVFAERLGSVPLPTDPALAPTRAPSTRWGVITLVLGALAVLLILVATTFPMDPVVVPDAGGDIGGGSSLEVIRVRAFDPFGDGAERDRLLPNLVDGDTATVWTTEAYSDPLPLIKAGVGVTFELAEAPTKLVLDGVSAGAAFEVRTNRVLSGDVEEWTAIQRVVADGSQIRLTLSETPNRFWMIWFVDLPADGRIHRAAVGEVRFR